MNVFSSQTIYLVFCGIAGDRCTLQSSNSKGVCRVLSLCIPAREKLKKGISPDLCGFKGVFPVVCCEEVSTTSNPESRIATEPAYEGYGATSRKKCWEYQKYVYEKELVNYSEVTSDTCALVAIPNIVGGTEALTREFPHMALIGFDNKGKPSWECGGSLISDEFVLTAAHCMYQSSLGEPKYVRLGDVKLFSNSGDENVQDFTISQLIRHPDFKPPSNYHDIGLVKLNRKVNLNSYARPACLHTNFEIPVKKAVAAGWGKVGFTDGGSDDLLKVTLEFFTHAECNRTYRANIGMRLRKGIDDSSQVCTGHHELSRDTCQGDSGGPLLIINSDPNVRCMYSIVGITSFGRGCGAIGIPGVYTRVSNYVGWIEQNVWS
ncbi:hypothetical protein PPYR_03881 [Photinus pyralis]|uniref:Peptidase S1 domain-containing protein n=1 Tax=Photinus pyralis TaxID=7054 RepID=A0A5N4AWS7_PHOPY|nr:serine protease snake-like [Photinus pyralis]KAB0801690.1 hypothetical protein PPYR_03876 [Photinus pyralis]KAB0801695.1 hypothetical protein PPYR_03881 [Photinus pyralis]